MDDEGASLESNDDSNVTPEILVQFISLSIALINLGQKIEHEEQIPILYKIENVLINQFPDIEGPYPKEMKIDIGLAFSAARTLNIMKQYQNRQIATNYDEFGGVHFNGINVPNRFLDSVIGTISISSEILNMTTSSIVLMKKIEDAVTSHGYNKVNFYSDLDNLKLYFFIYKIK